MVASALDSGSDWIQIATWNDWNEATRPEVVCHRAESELGLVRPQQPEVVLVLDDGPTITHGGMPYGAGLIVAEDLGASEIIDPRPHLKGLLNDTFAQYPNIGKMMPAMGYSDQQIADLEASINDSDADLVVGTRTTRQMIEQAVPTVSGKGIWRGPAVKKFWDTHAE